MKIKYLLLLIIIIATTACSSSKKSSSLFGKSSNNPTAVTKSTDNGLSYETAIVITETTESKGVTAEYDWIKNHYTNYNIKGQALNTRNGKPYDIITIILSDAKELRLYFDISNYFGKS